VQFRVISWIKISGREGLIQKSHEGLQNTRGRPAGLAVLLNDPTI